jgi:hypothetical protein
MPATTVQKEPRKHGSSKLHRVALQHPTSLQDEEIEPSLDPADDDNVITLTLPETMRELTKTKEQISALETQIENLRQYGMQLSEHVNKIQGEWFGVFGETFQPVRDGRTILNPVKNLKISVRRAYDWAKKGGKDAVESRDHVRRVIRETAKNRYKMVPLSPDVEVYIDHLAEHFDRIGTKAQIPVA